MVIRRKLFTYTVIFAAGISAGFFIFEKARLTGGSLFMVSAGIVIWFAAGADDRVRRILLACLVSGFLIFTSRYIFYGTGLQLQADISGAIQETKHIEATEHPEVTKHIKDKTYSHSEYAEITGRKTDPHTKLDSIENIDSIDSIENIEGFVYSVTMKDDRAKIVLTDTDVTRRGVGVMVNLYDADDFDPAVIIGTRIRAYGKLKEAPSADNPGCFDYRVYLRSKGIGYLFTAKHYEICNLCNSECNSDDVVNNAENVTCIVEDAPIYFRNVASYSGNRAFYSIDPESRKENEAWHSRNTESIKKQSLSNQIRSLYGRYRRRMYLIREDFLDLFDQAVRSFIKGTVFGDKSDIDEETIEDFALNGTGHMLAVSGLHTGFLYALLRMITGRRRTLGATLMIVTVLFLYGEMTMWSPSAMRAVTVLSISLMSVYVRRPFDLLSSVSAAAFVILIREPYQLFSTGFQMSFIALLGICFFAGPLEHFIGEWLAVPIAVQTAIAPLTAYVFHRLNVVSVFINIPVIFLASIMVPACMSALLINLLIGTVPDVLITLIEGLTEITIRFNGILTAGGILSNLVSSGIISGALILSLYLFLLLVSSEWFRIRVLRHEVRMILISICCILVLSACTAAASYNGFADDEIVFVSVGQGDCTHIRAAGKDVLIDGGGDIERNVGKEVLMPYLLSNGAERAEIGLVTHLHTDHYLGLVQLSEVYPVGAVGIPSDYRRSIEKQRNSDSSGSADEMQSTEKQRYSAASRLPDEMQRGNSFDNHQGKTNRYEGYYLPDKIEYIEQGSRIMMTDEVYVEPIWPPKGRVGDIDVEDPNENNTVYLVNYRGVKILVTGDILEEDEHEMISYYHGRDVLDCDILRIAHHGSKSSSSEEFLDAVSPKIAVISVGLGNFYGHPHQQTLDRLAERGIAVYRTDLNGAVGIDIHGNLMTVDVMRQ